MRERVLLFCPLGLVLTATIILLIAPGARDLGAGLHRFRKLSALGGEGRSLVLLLCSSEDRNQEDEN
jgi:hypothetical protein